MSTDNPSNVARSERFESDESHGSPLDASRDGATLGAYVAQNGRAVVNTTRELLGFDTQNPPGETTDIIDWLASYFDELGIDTRRPSLKVPPLRWYTAVRPRETKFIREVGGIPFLLALADRYRCRTGAR